MKKLNLGKLKLTSEEVLQRSQLAAISGGASGTCGYATNDGTGWYGDCNVSRAEALFMIQGYASGSAYWCCDNCSSTFYCG